nr:retrovirus-related Pol polyprotein from transposon TNT 1-94 [Tanacetum cinerariifolium]
MYLSLVTNAKEERQSQCLLFMQTNWNPFGHPITGLVYVVLQVVQIVLWYLDSGCSRHMTGDRSKLINYVDKVIGIVRFENDEFATIVGYGDYKLGDTVITRVYYVEGLKHNLFGLLSDSDYSSLIRKRVIVRGGESVYSNSFCRSQGRTIADSDAETIKDQGYFILNL